MTTEIKKCSPGDHPFDLKYVCRHPNCSCRLLCPLCYQKHYQVCEGVYGKTLQELPEPQAGRVKQTSTNESETPMENTSETTSDNKINQTVSIATGDEFIAPYQAMKLSVQQPIHGAVAREKTICKENIESLEPVIERIAKLVPALLETWKNEQEQKLIGMSESSQEIRAKLEEIQNQVQCMHFDPANLIKSDLQRHELETRIAPEAKKLVKSIHEIMDGWVLNQDRIKDYEEAVTKFIQGIEFTALLNKEKLEFKTASLPQVSDDEVQKIRKEVETLRNGDLDSKEYIHELREEIKKLKKEKSDAEAVLREQKTAAESALAQEKEASKNALVREKEASKNALAQEKEVSQNALAALREQMTAVENTLAQEKEASKNALAQEKEASKNALAQEKEASKNALAQEKEASKKALADLTHAKDADIARITKEFNDFKAAIPK